MLGRAWYWKIVPTEYVQICNFDNIDMGVCKYLWQMRGECHTHLPHMSYTFRMFHTFPTHVPHHFHISPHIFCKNTKMVVFHYYYKYKWNGILCKFPECVRVFRSGRTPPPHHTRTLGTGSLGPRGTLLVHIVHTFQKLVVSSCTKHSMAMYVGPFFCFPTLLDDLHKFGRAVDSARSLSSSA